jgi:fatty acid desaturase
MTAVRQMFWAIALGVIAAYAFFVALGAFSPGDVTGVTIAVGCLLALWVAHVWSARHHEPDHDQELSLRSARERRGF